MSKAEGQFGAYGQHRFWEILPGALLWGTLILALVLSFIVPLWVIVFIIVFDVLWLFRVGYFIIYLGVSWRAYRKTIGTNWEAKLEGLPCQDIHHVIFLPTYGEGEEIVRSTFASLKNAAFPSKRMIVVLAGEERDRENFEKNKALVQREFGDVFKKVYFTEHPADLPNEIPGKGSNLNWAGHRTAELLQKDFPELKDEHVVVSAFDVDTLAHEQYFAYLTYLFCTIEDPLHTSYQPVALFANNIWTTPAPVRISAFGTTFWLLTELARPDRMWTFSSHSMPLTMLKDVGFWQKDIVSEDSRIFMQAFIHYHGDYRVTPMFMPVSMDTVTGRNYWEALGALYKQIRRWAWGVEHLAYMVPAFRADKQMPLRKKFRYLFNQIEGPFTWGTAPILMFILGWLPLKIAEGRTNALIQAAPFTLEQLMQLALAGVFASALVALTMLPPRPQSVKPHAWVVMIFQWALLPVTFILFGSIPAIDAQTRLMLGKYLGFNVTKKAR